MKWCLPIDKLKKELLMADAFTGEIRMFAGDFAPYKWEFCDGHLISISQNQELYLLLGTAYGGDGIRTFALPDMRGRVPVHFGSGEGLTKRDIGQRFGECNVKITEQTMPSHTHSLMASSDLALSKAPGGNALAKSSASFYDDGVTEVSVSLSPSAVGERGGNQPHDNMQAYLGMNFIICLSGNFPNRN